MSGSNGARQVISAATKAVNYYTFRFGLLPQPHTDESLANQVFLVLWKALLTSNQLLLALRGEGRQLTPGEEAKLVDQLHRSLGQEDTPAGLITPEEAGQLLDTAFRFESRDTPLYAGLASLLTTAISRLIQKARARPRLSDGTTSDGRRIRVNPRFHALGEGMAVTDDTSRAVADKLDVREAFARLSALERAVCEAYFVEGKKLRELEEITWTDDQGRQITQSMHQIRDVRDRAIGKMRSFLGSGRDDDGGH